MTDLTKRQMLAGAVAATAALSAGRAAAQVADRKQLDRSLYPGPGLPGGGQLEVRMVATAWDIPDRDAIEFAERLKPFDPESWYQENTRLAERNAERAEHFLTTGRYVTAGEYHLRATGYYRNAVLYLPVSDDRMLPAYRKLQDSHAKAWSILPPPFEVVQIPYEGRRLRGHFFAAHGAPGQKLPVVFNYGGADGILLNAAPDGNSGFFRARGMSYLDVDGPGQGAPLRFDKLYSPPDVERFGKAITDYLKSRADVDPKRIGFHGSSMGGYYAPRCATVNDDIAAVAVWSGAYRLQRDIYDYYPPIRERLRWLIGASDYTDARRRFADFTLDGIAQKIRCPLLVGYGSQDRVMDPHGAFDLYAAASGSANRTMIDGVGHQDRKYELRTYLADWMAVQLRSLPEKGQRIKGSFGGPQSAPIE